MKQNWLQSDWLTKVSITYLILPFVIFCLLFLKIEIGLPIVIILCWFVWRIWKPNPNSSNGISISKSDLIIGLTVIGIWVLLSGIGGFAFQNSDHHIRNAIFRDLINYNWPVYYPQASSFSSSSYALIYYIGYWLPAALIGKLFGWQAANIGLFIWTWIGVFLAAFLLKKRIKATLLASTLLLVFFSGMDILGTVIMHSVVPGSYPQPWPPITHLEWWAPTFQYSSFTTQLFWVFNQAVPAWICMALILSLSNRRYVFFIWSLCFFFSPIPALGMLPFTLLVIPHKSFNPEEISLKWQGVKLIDFFRRCLTDIIDTVSLENILGGGIVLVTSYLYLSANPNGSKISFYPLNLATAVIFVTFLIIEFLLLWSLFYKEQRKNLWWYLTGAILIVIPLIIFGSSSDFCMRASIPALFLLMTWSGEALFRKPKVNYYGALVLLLVLGCFTPLYEINRSIYRTIKYDLGIPTTGETSIISRGEELPIPYPELDHPSTLTADLYPSLSVFNPEDIPNFVGMTNNSFFFRYLAKPP